MFKWIHHYLQRDTLENNSLTPRRTTSWMIRFRLMLRTLHLFKGQWAILRPQHWMLGLLHSILILQAIARAWTIVRLTITRLVKTHDTHPNIKAQHITEFRQPRDPIAIVTQLLYNHMCTHKTKLWTIISIPHLVLLTSMQMLQILVQ